MNSKKSKKRVISFMVVCLGVICIGIPSFAATEGSSSGTYGSIYVTRYDGSGGTDAYQKTSAAKWVEANTTIYNTDGAVIGSKVVGGEANAGMPRSAYAYSSNGVIVGKTLGKGFVYGGKSPSTPLLQSLSKTVIR